MTSFEFKLQTSLKSFYVFRGFSLSLILVPRLSEEMDKWIWLQSTNEETYLLKPQKSNIRQRSIFLLIFHSVF